jgi:hypothetical protein
LSSAVLLFYLQSVAAEALTDLFNSTAEAPPLEIISSLRDVLGGLSEGTTFPPNISRLVFDSVGDLIGTVRESDGDGVRFSHKEFLIFNFSVRWSFGRYKAL